MRPTRCTLTLAAASGALLGVALLIDDPAFLFAGASLVVVLGVFAVAFTQKTREILSSVSIVRRSENNVARQGAQITIVLSVTCRTPPGTRIHIREILPSDSVRTGSIPEIMLPGENPSTVVYQLVPLTHGILKIGGIRLDIADRFFRTTTEMTAPEYAGPTIEVMPVPCFVTPGIEQVAGTGRRETNRFSIYKGSNIISYRDYVNGDNLRFVDWKLSAKYGKLIVRQYGAQEKKPGLIVLDLPEVKEEFDTAAFAGLINRVTGEAEQSIIAAGEVSILLISGINLTGMLLNERSLPRCISWIRKEAYPRNRLYHAYRLETENDLRITRRRMSHQADRAGENPPMLAFLQKYDDVLFKNLMLREKYIFDVQISRLLQQAGPFDEVQVYSLLNGDISHIRHILFAVTRAHSEKRLLSPAFSDRKIRSRFAEWYGARNIKVIS